MRNQPKQPFPGLFRLSVFNGGTGARKRSSSPAKWGLYPSHEHKRKRKKMDKNKRIKSNILDPVTWAMTKSNSYMRSYQADAMRNKFETNSNFRGS